MSSLSSYIDLDTCKNLQNPQILSSSSAKFKVKVFHYNHLDLPDKDEIPYDRICCALSNMRFPDKYVFAQFWACINMQSCSILTTRGQPFGVSVCTDEFSSYRIDCLDHNSYVHHKTGSSIGVAGRVHLTQSSKWIQDESNDNGKMYPQLQEAMNSKIRGYLAMPLSEGVRRYGVLEFAFTTFKNTFSDEMREVYRALQDVGLDSRIDIDYCAGDSGPIETLNSKSKEISCNDVTKLFGLTKAAAAKRCGIAAKHTFTKLHKRYGIVEWPCLRSGVAISYSHRALLHGGAFEMSYKLAMLMKDINSMVMEENDDIDCDANILQRHMENLISNTAVGKRVEEEHDDESARAVSVLLEPFYNRNK